MEKDQDMSTCTVIDILGLIFLGMFVLIFLTAWMLK